MEDQVSKSNELKSGHEELRNGFVELTNGVQETLVMCNEGISTTNLDEINEVCGDNEILEDALINGASNVDPVEASLSYDFIASAAPDDNVAMEEDTKPIIQVDGTGIVSDSTNFSNQLEEAALPIVDEAGNNFILTKEEPQLFDYNESETSVGLDCFTISNVFTETATGEEPTNDIEAMDETSNIVGSKNIVRASRKKIKFILKQAKAFSSIEYLWLMVQLAPKCSMVSEKLQQMISKLVSEDCIKTTNELLEKVNSFTTEEYQVLFNKLRAKRSLPAPTECVKEFSLTIMWFKTNLEADPEGSITKVELFNSYSGYCNMQLIKSLKNSEFTNLMRHIYPLVREKRRNHNGVKRYYYSGIKKRTTLHTPKLPKYAEDQLHNNMLISQYMSCHNCCSLFSSLILQKQTTTSSPKYKIKGLQAKSIADSKNAPPIMVHDPLDLLNVTAGEQNNEKNKTKLIKKIDLTKLEPQPGKPMRQVAKKSVFPKRIKKIPAKYREFIPITKADTLSTSVVTSPSKVNNNESTATLNYFEELQKIKDKLSRFVITKTENDSKYKVSCTCCEDIFFVSKQHGAELIAAQEKLLHFYQSAKHMSTIKHNHHPSVKHLYYSYENIILPENVVYQNIDPAVSINRFEVYDWFKGEISTLKHKLLENALNALSSSGRRNRYELKVPSDVSSHTPTQITPPHPPIYISAVRETPREKPKSDRPKITEVFIKSESESKSGKKRHNSNEPEAVEISAVKKPKPSSTALTNTSSYSRNRHTPYTRRKDIDFIYFPAIDTSSNNLRLANLGVLYKCILCLMLFNTEQKLFDHEKAHLFCHKCKRKLRDVEVMRVHLIKHCQRNHRKRKPTLKIHKVDSISIMVKKYGEIFQMCNEYYKDLLKPKKKYREMIRPKIEPLPLPPVQEIFIEEFKPPLELLLPEMMPVKDSYENGTENVTFVDVKPPLLDVSNIPAATEMPTLSLASLDDHVQQPSFVCGNDEAPPKLAPLPSTSSNPKKKNINKEPNLLSIKRQCKIRVKDLMELS